ncbi:MAG: hypothetical protein IAE88_01795 [Rhodobacteraceae bacterium]|uniref:hypothetical protein n=1 Tax=Accumulibacter sp. TaxID=2053492 RepID=UPI0019E72CAB|nr:hypothetical protein [Accumulibacter sp.]MBE2257558.1 hypothetical protein [Paracoccaceae bacterium]MCB1942366.1 hypothetical protein [Accumulibacter sp.]
MRIPAEVVPLVANVTVETDDVRKAAPVTSSAQVGDELSAALPDQSPAARDRPPRRPALAAANTPAAPENLPVAVERRRAERRSEQRPVLLDTRSQGGRRKAGGDVKINIKV